MRCAIYCRISLDATGEELGVTRQLEDCKALASSLGWEVLEVYVDNDISASSGKIRPQYRAMLSAIKAGEIQAVIAWHPVRLDHLTPKGHASAAQRINAASRNSDSKTSKNPAFTEPGYQGAYRDGVLYVRYDQPAKVRSIGKKAS